MLKLLLHTFSNVSIWCDAQIFTLHRFVCSKKHKICDDDEKKFVWGRKFKIYDSSSHHQHETTTMRSCICFLLIDKFVWRNFDSKRFSFWKKKKKVLTDNQQRQRVSAWTLKIKSKRKTHFDVRWFLQIVEKDEKCSVSSEIYIFSGSRSERMGKMGRWCSAISCVIKNIMWSLITFSVSFHLGALIFRSLLHSHAEMILYFKSENSNFYTYEAEWS